MSKKLLLASNPASRGIPAEGVSLDGTTDYLSRTTDLVGNVDSKTFTFSAWVYRDTVQDNYIVQFGGGINGSGLAVNQLSGTSGLRIDGANNAGTTLFQFDVATPRSTFFNLIISIDLTNTAKRHVVINDAVQTVTWASYVNDLLGFTGTSHVIGSFSGGAKFKGRLSHLFLDYTYRDLSIEANRRLFITADGKPAEGQGLVDKYNLLPIKTVTQTSLYSLHFNPTGTKMYSGGYAAFDLFEYTLSTPFDVSTASAGTAVVTTLGYHRGIEISSNGLYLYSSTNNATTIRVTTLSTAWDFSTADGGVEVSLPSMTTVCYGITMSPNGTKFVVSDTGANIAEYTLSTPFNLSTATRGVVLSDVTFNSQDFVFNSDGTRLAMTNVYENAIRVYSLPTPYSLVGASLYSNLVIVKPSTQDSTSGITYADGKIYVLDSVSTTSNFTIRTATVPSNFSSINYGTLANTPTAPILYLPMKDAATAHINEGTGGNFVQNGTLDTAGRGANQDNCVASTFDGVADYLSKASLTGIADGKQFTISGSLHPNNTTYSNWLLVMDTSYFRVYISTSGVLSVNALNATGSTILSGTYTINGTVIGREHSIQISVDLTDINKRKIIFNGVDISGSFAWTTYTNDSIDFTRPNYYVGMYGGTQFSNCNIGELYFDTTYIDLATSNPFWDTASNRPKPVRQVIKETAVTPLIAMPLDASNAGKNYGTGGDFTVNSGPYVGARGASEFWARSAKFLGDASTYLTRGTPTGIADSTTASIVFAISHLQSKNTVPLSFAKDTSTIGFNIRYNPSGTSYVYICDQNGTIIKQFTYNNPTYVSGAWNIVCVNIDSINNSGNKIYVNGVASSLTFQVSNSGTIPFTSYLQTDIGIAHTHLSTENLNGYQSFTYFTTDYIDFSQEVNRNKFVDQLGYPKDLKAQIDAGIIPNPLIYLPFNDTSALGTNLGTGGNFTVNGSVLPSSDVLG